MKRIFEFITSYVHYMQSIFARLTINKKYGREE
jgi:hypothetical protein